MKTLVKTLVDMLFGALWAVIYFYVPLESNGGALAKMICSFLLGVCYVIALVEIGKKKDWKPLFTPKPEVYRVVTDDYNGYEVQFQRNFLGIKWWVYKPKVKDAINTFISVNEARKHAEEAGAIFHRVKKFA